MVLHVTYLRCTVCEICLLFSSVKLLGSRFRLQPAPPTTQPRTPTLLCLIHAQFLYCDVTSLSQLLTLILDLLRATPSLLSSDTWR